MATAMMTPVVAPADQVSGPPQGQWRYADYVHIPADNQCYEIIEGVLYMAPAPGTGHQFANNLFQTYLTMYVQFAGLGRVCGPPCDVELAPNVVVQPDVIVVLNANSGILTPSRIMGAPDLVVEIASPSTAIYDRHQKLQAYQHAGVKEYWIADAGTQTVEVLVLTQSMYRSRGVFGGQATLPSTVVPQLSVRVEQFFA